MNAQTKRSASRFMLLWLMISWTMPMVLSIYRPVGPTWLYILAAGSPFPVMAFVLLTNKSLAVKYYTERAYAITMLVTASIATVSRVLLVVASLWLNVSVLVYLVSVVGLIASVISLLLFNYEAFEY
jgi:hypothetical protein